MVFPTVSAQADSLAAGLPAHTFSWLDWLLFYFHRLATVFLSSPASHCFFCPRFSSFTVLNHSTASPSFSLLLYPSMINFSTTNLLCIPLFFLREVLPPLILLFCFSLWKPKVSSLPPPYTRSTQPIPHHSCSCFSSNIKSDHFLGFLSQIK